MDILEQFIRDVAYKFPKGYPDMKNEQDILILENELKKLGIELLLENQNLINTLKKSGLFDEYGDIESIGKDTLKLIFSNIPGRGKQADQMRLDIYDAIKQLADKGDSISNFKNRFVTFSTVSVGLLRKPISRLTFKSYPSGVPFFYRNPL